MTTTKRVWLVTGMAVVMVDETNPQYYGAEGVLEQPMKRDDKVPQWKVQTRAPSGDAIVLYVWERDMVPFLLVDPDMRAHLTSKRAELVGEQKRKQDARRLRESVEAYRKQLAAESQRPEYTRTFYPAPDNDFPSERREWSDDTHRDCVTIYYRNEWPTTRVPEIEVSWSSFGAVSPLEAMRFARALMAAAEEAMEMQDRLHEFNPELACAPGSEWGIDGATEPDIYAPSAVRVDGTSVALGVGPIRVDGTATRGGAADLAEAR